MKCLLLSTIITVVVFTSCSKQNAAPETTLDEKIDTTTTGSSGVKIQYAGVFSNGPHGTVMRNVKIYLQSNGQLTLSLDSVTISNGPDLHVYLSKEIQPVNFIDVGKLKSTNGNQLYDISGMPDFTSYKYALIHCQQYDHLFGSAELKK